MNRSILAFTGFLLTLLTTLSYLPAEAPVLMMATTTSTDNTGLLDYLAPEFRKATGIELRWTATGTGKALKLGENCDVDILMVHAPAAEEKFVAAGYGVGRHPVMFNDFVVIGPENDPASVRGLSIKEALSNIQRRGATFVSRGDNSGTHKKELSLWTSAELKTAEREAWYVQTGQGMLITINMAAERQGYTLTDRGTYIKYESNMDGNPPLKIMVEGDADLLNQYSVIAVNPGHCPNAKSDLAARFVDWTTGSEGQKRIGDFKLLGKPLFTPNAKK